MVLNRWITVSLGQRILYYSSIGNLVVFWYQMGLEIVFVLFSGRQVPTVETHYFRPMFLNRRDASRYRDLKTFSPGLGTSEKLKTYQKLQWNQVFLRIKSLEKYIIGAFGHKTNSYRDKRQKNHFTGTWSWKGWEPLL